MSFNYITIGTNSLIGGRRSADLEFYSGGSQLTWRREFADGWVWKYQTNVVYNPLSDGNSWITMQKGSLFRSWQSESILTDAFIRVWVTNGVSYFDDIPISVSGGTPLPSEEYVTAYANGTPIAVNPTPTSNRRNVSVFLGRLTWDIEEF